MTNEYNRLADVTMIESLNDDASVLVENGGEVARIKAKKMVPPAASKVSELENDAGYIAAPAVAAVGQVIVVKEVDENGRPVAWEAVDAGSGGDVMGVLFTFNTDSGGYTEITCNKTYAEIMDAWGKNAISFQGFRRTQIEQEPAQYEESYFDIDHESVQYISEEGNEHLMFNVNYDVMNYYPNGEILMAGVE
jgi:hypothetical protein